MRSEIMRHIFIIGSNGIPASYGGFETFVEQLTAHKKDENIQYHVSCLSNNNKEFVYNGAHCFNIKVPKAGPAKAIWYDMASLEYCCRYIKKNQIEHAIIYMLGCGLGPFIGRYARKIHHLGAKYYVNPDGLEWERGKWKSWIKKYLKYSAKKMVICADLVVCDSEGIQQYFHEEYPRYHLRTTFIAYGSDTNKSNYSQQSPEVQKWFSDKKVIVGNYYLAVGRFVPENNFETMLTEFQKSNTKKDFILITNVEQNQYYEYLKEKTGFLKDKRIKFVGTVYDQDLLKYIREHAYGYLHGHEVGGTNPSLLEALASTKLNLLLDVNFNAEVGKDGAVYWSKENGSLSELINSADNWNENQINDLCENARQRITSYYNWENISNIYEKLFKGN